MGRLLRGVAAAEALFSLFLILRPLLKYRRRNAVAVEEPDVLKPSLSEPLELLPPERMPMPLSWAAAARTVAVGVDGFELLFVDVEVLVVDEAGVEAVVVGVARLAGRIAVTNLLLVRGEVFELELAGATCGCGVDFSPVSRPSARAIIAAERVLM